MTTTVSHSGKMPRSHATYEEYQIFLASYYLTYSHFESSQDPQKVENAKKIFRILNILAKNSGVPEPQSLVHYKGVEKFLNPEQARIDLVKFYNHFKNVHWNKNEEDLIGELTAILALPMMWF